MTELKELKKALKKYQKDLIEELIILQKYRKRRIFASPTYIQKINSVKDNLTELEGRFGLKLPKKYIPGYETIDWEALK